MLTLEDGRRVLRQDPEPETDLIITDLLAAVPAYIETTTGLSVEAQKDCALCDTAGTFLLRLWFFPDGADSEKLQRVVDNLLKTISAMTRK